MPNGQRWLALLLCALMVSPPGARLAQLGVPLWPCSYSATLPAKGASRGVQQLFNLVLHPLSMLRPAKSHQETFFQRGQCFQPLCHSLPMIHLIMPCMNAC
ncbi:hypothetical protein VPH35_127730 [Triticum aestivum]